MKDKFDHFKAGQQSKQAEIEGLEKKLKYEKLAYRNIKLQFLNKQDDLDELQKAWQHQQAIINDLQKTIVSLEAGLRKNSSNKQKLLSKNIELQKRVGELEHYKRDGFAVVPVDPTPDMIQSLIDEVKKSGHLVDFYKAMIAPYVK